MERVELELSFLVKRVVSGGECVRVAGLLVAFACAHVIRAKKGIEWVAATLLCFI